MILFRAALRDYPQNKKISTTKPIRNTYVVHQQSGEYKINVRTNSQSLIMPNAVKLFSETGDGLTVKAVVPRYKIRGETAVLRCDFELEGALLYAVKWYRENEEFYRFVPKSDPQMTSYVVDGIKVDVSIFCNNFSLPPSPIAATTTASKLIPFEAAVRPLNRCLYYILRICLRST